MGGAGHVERLARRWAETPRAELTPQAATAWLEDLQRFGEQYPDLPQHRDLEPLTPHLEAMRGRNDGEGVGSRPL